MAAREVVTAATIATNASMMVAAELQGVTKTYGPIRALIGVNVCFALGAVGVVTGPNGSGKSTLLSLLGTLTRPTTGRVSHAGLVAGSPRDARAVVRATLGWVGHDSLCYGDLTGRENVELAARLHGVPPALAFEAVAARFALGSFADRPVRTYSRGQRQRVALARALVHAPRLVLLDEPTTGLDVEAAASLVTVVREEAARGATVVVVTHDESFAAALGGVRVRLARGRLVS